MIYSPNDVLPEREVGAKARNLQLLSKAGYVVPAFVVLPSTTVDALNQGQYNIEDIVARIQTILPTNQLAVRSAALIEDTNQSAMAGQFHTELAVDQGSMAEAITTVITQAEQVLGSLNNNFSIVVQEFIAPEQAGVIFSRNPVGGREMVVEWNEGVGESVVGGEAVNRKLFYRHQVPSIPTYLPQLAQVAVELETTFRHPQDVEWAVKDKQLYILQTRPITSLTQNQYNAYTYLDTSLPARDFFYQQTSLSETFNRPTPLALSILQALHQPEGAIDRAYQTLSVSYVSTEQFKLLGNQLFIDKEAEVKSLFPAYGHFRSHRPRAHLVTLRGLGTTLKNSWNLSTARIKEAEVYQAPIHEALEEQWPEETIERSFSRLLNLYENVFLVSLVSHIATERLRALLRNTLDINQLLYAGASDTTAFNHHSISGTLIGNSISIDDTSKFTAATPQNIQSLADIPGWQCLSKTKQRLYEPKVKQVQRLIHAREEARWLSVKLISHLRASLIRSNAYEPFATIDEILAENIHQTTITERHNEHNADNMMDMPATVSSFLIENNQSTNTVVSPGRAEGVLVTKETIAATNGRKILLVEWLTPDLTKYFDEIEGIVSRNGGLLSHLAIMAREHKLPVVVSKKNQLDLLGQSVVIRGESGEIYKA